MSLQLSWIAVKDGTEEDLLDHLALEVIGETMWEVGQEYTLGKTDQGWWVVMMKHWPPKPDETMAMAAPTGSSLYGMMTDISMFSELRAYEGGRPSWSITRDCDMGRGVVAVQGSPPAPFEDIKRGLEAQQAAAGGERVDYLFDLPPSLSASLCGYQPAQGTLDWQVLGPKGKRTGPPLRSLTAAMKADLLPLLWSLGWRPADGPPRLWPGGEIIRDNGDEKQTIWFEYSSGRDTYVDVLFQRNEPTASGLTKVETGRGAPAYVRGPWWKRLGSPPKDPVGDAVEKAKADILAIDDYLKTGTRAPRIQAWGGEYPPVRTATPPSSAPA